MPNDEDTVRAARGRADAPTFTASPPPATSGDVIRLVLPAEPDYGRIARIATSSLALRLGFGYADIEDLRIAIDEAIIMLLRPVGTSELTVEFTIGAEGLVVDLFADGADGADDASGPQHQDIDEQSRYRFDEIVAGTVDIHEVDTARARVHLVKRY